MRSLRVRSVLVVSVLLQFACGPASVCDRLPPLQTAVTAKRGTCAVTLTLGSESTCNAALASGLCSTSDEAAIGRVYDCYGRLPNCVPGTESAWLAQFSACGMGTGISSNCRF